MIRMHLEHNRDLIDELDNTQKELQKYKKMYADELQKRLELAKLVEEKSGGIK